MIIWKVPSFRIVSKITLSGNISWAKANREKKQMILSTYFGPIYCLDLSDELRPRVLWKTQQSFYSYFNRSFDIDFSQNIIYAASILMNTQVLKFNLRKKKMGAMIHHALNVYTIKKERRSGRLYSGGFSGTLKVASLRSGKREREFKGFHDSYISNIYVSEYQKLVFVGDWKGKIRILKALTLELAQEVQISDSVYFMTFTEKDTVFFAGGRSSFEIVKFALNC